MEVVAAAITTLGAEEVATTTILAVDIAVVEVATAETMAAVEATPISRTRRTTTSMNSRG